MSLNSDRAGASISTPVSGLSRRDLIVTAGAATALAAAGRLPARAAATDVIKIGYLSPRSGGLASNLAADGYVLDQVRAALKSGLTIGGKTYDVQVLDRDTQSDPKRAGEVAASLITQDRVDLVLSTYTPETINPVADACEAAGVPRHIQYMSLGSLLFGTRAKPGQPSPFKWTYIFSFGVAEFANSYLSQWALLPTNKKVGAMYPDDPDGRAVRAAMIPMLEKGGYTVIDPGPYQDGASDYSSQIELFKKEQCEIYNSFPLPPDFPVFWRQAALAGWTKMVKISQINKAGTRPHRYRRDGLARLSNLLQLLLA